MISIKTNSQWVENNQWCVCYASLLMGHCPTQSFFGHICTYIYHALEWNMVKGPVRKRFRIKMLDECWWPWSIWISHWGRSIRHNCLGMQVISSFQLWLVDSKVDIFHNSWPLQKIILDIRNLKACFDSAVKVMFV